MTMRVHQDDPRTAVPNSDWAFADCTSTPFPGVPNPQKVCLKNGFDTNHIYELIYTAKNPIVMGLGLAAIRDVATFFRRAKSSAGNPIAGAINFSLLNGISQSGRLLRTYLNLGFNLGEDGQQVFDGMQPHIGAVENYINVRFSQPGRLAGTQHTEKQYPGPDSPLTYARRNDPLLGEPRGLLDRCTRTNTCPKIIHTMSDIEYWEFLRGGGHDRTAGQVRPAAAAGCAHLSVLQQPTWRVLAGGASSDLDGDMRATAGCEHVHLQYPSAPGCTRRLGGAGQKPPDSRYSLLKDGSLAPVDNVAFPTIPGVTGPQGIFNTRLSYFRGPQMNTDDVSGIIVVEPPTQNAMYPSLAPQVNSDGNDIGGLRSHILQAPLGTYTGWNVRRAGFSQGDACDLTGSYIPFAITKAQRLAAGDPRLARGSAMSTTAGYVNAVTTAVNKLVSERANVWPPMRPGQSPTRQLGSRRRRRECCPKPTPPPQWVLNAIEAAMPLAASLILSERAAMSAIGTKRTCALALHMSGFGVTADMPFCRLHMSAFDPKRTSKTKVGNSVIRASARLASGFSRRHARWNCAGVQ